MTKKSPKRLSILQNFTRFFFTRARWSLLLFVGLLVGGAYVYTSTIQKEGFPPVQFPLAIVSGQYFIDDAERIDADVVQPLYEIIAPLDGVDKVQSVANDNVYRLVVFFDENTTAEQGVTRISRAVEQTTSSLPEEASIAYQSIEPAKFLNEYDLLLSVYGRDQSSPAALENVATYVADQIDKNDEITGVSVQPLVTSVENPASGDTLQRQTSFSRTAVEEDGELVFYPAITIGVNKSDEIDVLELSGVTQATIDGLDLSGFEGDFAVTRSADFADSVSSQIDSLEENLLTGLIAVSLVSLLLISWRASIVTSLFMVSVMATVVLLLWILGLTLNTITLFGLVLSLGLFVDDATIVVEAIDAARSSRKKKRDAVLEAIKRVAGASVAGTLTTVLVFLPLVFVGGILGEFIRLLPITVIIALLTSLVLSLSIIPVLSKYVLFSRRKFGFLHSLNLIAKIESFLSERLSRLPLLFTKNKKKAYKFAVVAMVISLLFVGGAGYVSSLISFNIFPPTKDSEQIAYSISFAPGTTITEAEERTDQVNAAINEEAGEYIKRVAFGRTSQSNERSADALIELTSIESRDATSPDILSSLQEAVNAAVENSQASVRFIQIDAGPPAEQYPFKMQVYGETLDASLPFAQEVSEELSGADVTLSNGEVAKISDTRVTNVAAVARDDGKRFIEVQAAFDSDDTSALVSATQNQVQRTFTDGYLTQRNISRDDIRFDFGQESDNADSFASLSIAFPVALLLMYILLMVQFKSFVQPLLIFIAIPFSLFGVFLGLYLTDNPFSFFVQVGLIGLIGIAVNNTIMLTDYANQEMRAGKNRYHAISEATKLRFRPLLATSITTVVALVPLALSDPFWEPLALTIIFGLLSSTFLVIIAFPYYFLIFEWLRHSSVVKLIALWCIGLVIGFIVIGFGAPLGAFIGLYILISFVLRKLWVKIVH